MANPSKRYPWAVEFKPPAIEGWYATDAYRYEDEARMRARLLRERDPKGPPVRVRNIVSGYVAETLP